MDAIAYLKENYTAVELQHAWRFNGVVDVYKKMTTVFIIPENTYYQVKNEEELMDVVINHLEHHKERPAFKKTSSGRMSYQEFKHKDQMDNKKGNREDKRKMPYGKYIGQRLDSIPADYFIWLFDNNKLFGLPMKYFRENEDNLRMEAENHKKGIR